MQILVIRHGQSQADVEDRLEGRADFPPLTELGQEQALSAAWWIRDHCPPELVLSSTLVRAAATARAISEAVQVELRFEPLLMEWDNGKLAGLLREEADRLYPPRPPAGGRKPPHDTNAETESMIQFRARAETFWSKFTHEYILPARYQRVALVSHGGMINMLFRCFAALPLTDDVFLASGDTGIHLWEVTQEGGRGAAAFYSAIGRSI